jgi:acyl-CoA thioesterase I
LSFSRSFAGAALIVHLAACSGGQTDETISNVQASPAPAPSAKAEIEDGKLVLAFGDSLYAGYGVLPQQSFPWRLEQALKQQGVAATVRNAGVSGDTTGAGLQRLNYTLDGLGRKPDLVVLGLGGNDMLRGIPPKETEANLRAIMTELKRRNIPMILTGMVAAPNMGRDYVERFNAIYPALAKEFGAGLYPFFLEGVVTDRALMLDDRIHPNPAGIDRVVERVAPLVAERLKA